jgi:hypothetical protein
MCQSKVSIIGWQALPMSKFCKHRITDMLKTWPIPTFYISRFRNAGEHIPPAVLHIGVEICRSGDFPLSTFLQEQRWRMAPPPTSTDDAIIRVDCENCHAILEKVSSRFRIETFRWVSHNHMLLALSKQ